MLASPTAPGPMARSPIRAPASPTPASARARRRVATEMLRAGIMATRHGRRASTGMTVPEAARSAPIPHAASAAMPVRPRDFPTGSSATRSLIRRARAAVRSGPMRHAAKVFEKTAIGHEATALSARGRRAMVIVPAAIGPSENSAATRNSRAVRPTAARARILAAGTARAARGIARAARATVARIAASQNLGRSAMLLRPIMPGAILAHPAHAISTSRVTTSPARTAAATSVRGFRVRAKIVPG